MNMLAVIWVLSMAEPHHDLFEPVEACTSEKACVLASDYRQMSEYAKYTKDMAHRIMWSCNAMKLVR